MSDGALRSPTTSTIAPTFDSRPDAEDRIGLAMVMDAIQWTHELNESPESDGAVDCGNVNGAGVNV